jgi:cytochrome c biogenesis protein CcmG, thiol:disulfide interchange protein DsbE
MRLFIVGALLAAVGMSPTVASGQAKAGSKAPEIELPTLAGGASVKLSALRGHPVLITFWGTWCPPCRDEFPQLVAAYKTYHASGLEIVAIDQRDQELSLKDVQAFADTYAVPFTVALDTRGRSRRTYRLVGLPTTVFIDTAGTIVQMQPGPVSQEALARGLALIVKER